MRALVLLVAAAALLAGLCTSPASADPPASPYVVGAGKADVTGVVAGQQLQGYADGEQVGKGLHTRLYARAFVIAAADKPERRVCFVVADIWAPSLLVREHVLRKLTAVLGDASPYDESTLMIGGTHTHGGPGGYQGWVLYDINNGGFDERTFHAIVDGIVDAVLAAHRSARPGRLSLGHADAPDGLQHNRSPGPWARNPEQDKAKENRRMTLLRLADGETGKVIGEVNWFALHPTSEGRKNRLVSADNKGFAEWLAEARSPGLVSAFGQGDCGDITPNFLVDKKASTKGADVFLRDEGSSRRVGLAQFELAAQAGEAASAVPAGPVAGAVQHADLEADTGCEPTYGTNFAAGTEDGRGFSYLFTEGDKGLGPVKRWMQAAAVGFVHDVLSLALGHNSSEDNKRCHAPKRPLIATKPRRLKYPLVPPVVPVAHAVRVGPLLVLGVPFELTTVAAARVRASALEAASPHGVTEVVTSSVVGCYSGYATTREEYQLQHYEGASTLYGPGQLEAIQKHAAEVAAAAAKGQEPARPGPRPVVPQLDEMKKVKQPGPDKLRKGEQYGDLVGPVTPSSGTREVSALAGTTVVALGDKAEAWFAGSHPAHTYGAVVSYCTVQARPRGADDGAWETFRADGHPETTFRYSNRRPRKDGRGGRSQGPLAPTYRCAWNTPASGTDGASDVAVDRDSHEYRICAEGVAVTGKAKKGGRPPLKGWRGCSNVFHVAKRV